MRHRQMAGASRKARNRTRLIGAMLSFLFAMIMKRLVIKAIRFFRTGMWQVKREDTSAIAFLLLEILKKLVLAIRFFTAKRVMTRASALTYSTLLAIVPILAVMFAIARGFGYNKYIESWFLDAFKSQPEAAEVIVGFVNNYLSSTQGGVFLGVGLAFMLYTVLNLVRNIETVFNEIWQVKKQRSLYRTFTDYLAMLFMFPVFIIMSSGLSIFVATLSNNVAKISLLSPAVKVLLALSPYVLMSMVFMALYVFMPNTHVKLRSCVVPGILAGIAMQVLQIAYIHSQMWVSRYNAIYGSFAALPLFMLWVQISWTICLFGAELCYTNQNLDYYDYDAKTSDISHRYRIILCAMLLGCVSKRFVRSERPYSAQELSDKTGIPIRIAVDLLFIMQESGLLLEISSDEKGEATRYVPSESPHTLSVGTMIDKLETNGKWSIDMPLHCLDGMEWNKVMKFRSDYLHNMRNVLLKDLWKGNEDGK